MPLSGIKFKHVDSMTDRVATIVCGLGLIVFAILFFPRKLQDLYSAIPPQRPAVIFQWLFVQEEYVYGSEENSGAPWSAEAAPPAEFLPTENLWPIYQKLDTTEDKNEKANLSSELTQKSLIEIGSLRSSVPPHHLAPKLGDMALVQIKDKHISLHDKDSNYIIANAHEKIPAALHYGKIYRSRETRYFHYMDEWGEDMKKEPGKRNPEATRHVYQPILGHEPLKTWPLPVHETVFLNSEELEDIEPLPDCHFYVTYTTGLDARDFYVAVLLAKVFSRIPLGKAYVILFIHFLCGLLLFVIARFIVRRVYYAYVEQ